MAYLSQRLGWRPIWIDMIGSIKVPKIHVGRYLAREGLDDRVLGHMLRLIKSFRRANGAATVSFYAR